MFLFPIWFLVSVIWSVGKSLAGFHFLVVVCIRLLPKYLQGASIFGGLLWCIAFLTATIAFCFAAISIV